MEPETETAPTTPGQGLNFDLSEDGRTLLAIYTPVEGRIPIDEAWLRQAIADKGFAGLPLAEPALKQLVQQYGTAGEAFRLEIGSVRDAEVTVEIAPDKMAAYLTVTPPQGGVAVTREQIFLALIEQQLVSHLLEAEIDAVVAAGTAEHRLIAQGRAPVDGVNGRLQCLIDMAKQRHPHLDEHGIANYRDLGGIVTVSAGERLMQNIPPTPGEDGENVLGQVVPAKPGKEATFASDLSGTQIDPEDPTLLLAASAGQPVLVPNGVRVEPTITMEQVDLRSGNVNFDGSVNVTGDVSAGMEIRATGDIHVGGTVEAAILDAGGDVVVKGGIIGHGEVHQHPGAKQKSMIARIHCGVSCSARFVENASIEAGDSIMVEQQVMQSELAAVNQIVVGKPGSRHGDIIGGLTEATLLVHAMQLGSSAGVRTRVVVGTNPYLQEQLHQIGKDLTAKANELDEVLKLLVFFKKHPDRVKREILLKATKTRAALLREIEEGHRMRDELTQQLDLSQEAKVEVEKAVFGSVQVEIGGKVRNVNSQREGCTFLLKDGEIELLE